MKMRVEIGKRNNPKMKSHLNEIVGRECNVKIIWEIKY